MVATARAWHASNTRMPTPSGAIRCSARCGHKQLFAQWQASAMALKPQAPCIACACSLASPSSSSSSSGGGSTSMCLSQGSKRMHRWRVAATGSSGEDVESLTAVFAAEVAKRQAAEAAAAEAAAAREFDGAALLALVQKKYGRSYDFSLVQRQYMGKHFVALNVMWRYKEQASWSYSEEDFEARLNYIACALVAWGVVTSVQTQLEATKERPRVGKAVSLFLDVPPEQAAEWLAP